MAISLYYCLEEFYNKCVLVAIGVFFGLFTNVLVITLIRGYCYLIFHWQAGTALLAKPLKENLDKMGPGSIKNNNNNSQDPLGKNYILNFFLEWIEKQ